MKLLKMSQQTIISKPESLKTFNSISQLWHVDTLFPHISWELALQLSSLFWLPLCCIEAQWSNELSCAVCHHCEGVERGDRLVSGVSTGNIFEKMCAREWINVLFIFSAGPSHFWDQAPHLVYLTSWVGHSISVSVSLSNTPSEVSLVDIWRPRHRPSGHLDSELTVKRLFGGFKRNLIGSNFVC